jgi:hypothetical protein
MPGLEWQDAEAACRRIAPIIPAALQQRQSDTDHLGALK